MTPKSERPPGRPLQLALFDSTPGPEDQRTGRQPGPPCLACGAPTVISYPATRGQHHAKIDCTRCRAWRWAPRPRPTRIKD
jgi:hypothetical protein